MEAWVTAGCGLGQFGDPYLCFVLLGARPSAYVLGCNCVAESKKLNERSLLALIDLVTSANSLLCTESCELTL